jgi:hypothetical protein
LTIPANGIDLIEPKNDEKENIEVKLTHLTHNLPGSHCADYLPDDPYVARIHD